MSRFDPSVYESVHERVDAFLAIVSEHLGGDPGLAEAALADVVAAGRQRS